MAAGSPVFSDHRRPDASPTSRAPCPRRRNARRHQRVREKITARQDDRLKILEVRAGIEPAYADLQSDASPLCHRTPDARLGTGAADKPRSVPGRRLAGSPGIIQIGPARRRDNPARRRPAAHGRGYGSRDSRPCAIAETDRAMPARDRGDWSGHARPREIPETIGPCPAVRDRGDGSGHAGPRGIAGSDRLTLGHAGPGHGSHSPRARRPWVSHRTGPAPSTADPRPWAVPGAGQRGRQAASDDPSGVAGRSQCIGAPATAAGGFTRRAGPHPVASVSAV
jgi:hypothetical protein